MAFGLDESLNWIMTHWYYFLILGLVMVLVQWYQELKRFRSQFIRWCQDRQDITIPKEQSINPSLVFKKLLKMHPFSDKTKLTGKIISYSEEPVKGNPAKNILCRITTKPVIPIINFPIGKPKNYCFMKSDVFMDETKGTIKVPANYFWERNWEGTFILISPHISEVKDWTDEKMYKDLHETSIDGYASQMTSYSSVKPTWGHEERVMEKENEGRALGFGSFLKKKKEPTKTESEG
jgi:hypothetical protein